jgi:hypothetical protein
MRALFLTLHCLGASIEPSRCGSVGETIGGVMCHIMVLSLHVLH